MRIVGAPETGVAEIVELAVGDLQMAEELAIHRKNTKLVKISFFQEQNKATHSSSKEPRTWGGVSVGVKNVPPTPPRSATR